MRTVVGLDGTDVFKDAVLALLVTAVSQAIDQHCHRTFTTMVTVRTYEAPASHILWIDDFLITGDFPTPVVTVGGVQLATAQYQFRPLSPPYEEPHYTSIYRLTGANGLPTNWATPGERKLVTIQGVWGYAEVLPAQIREVCRIMAARLYQREIAQYGNEHGQSAGGIGFVQAPKASLDADCNLMLAPFVKQWSFWNKPGWQR
jgi:hypothetical protein